MPRRPKVSDDDIGAGFKEEERRNKLDRCKRDSWYLATEILGLEWSGRAGLTERLHKWICRWWDRYGARALGSKALTHFFGLWMSRGRHKTTLACVFLIQQGLRDPTLSHRYWTPTERHADDVTDTLIDWVRNCDELRALDPVGYDPGKPPLKKPRWYKIFPHKNKKFYTKSKGDCSINITRHKKASRGPWVRIQSALAEATGAHVDGLGIFDDIISERTIKMSQLGEVAKWVQRTALNVIDNRWVFNIGTPWSDHSIHQQWMEDPDWWTRVIPGAIAEDDDALMRIASDERKVHFAPDYKFANPVTGPPEYKATARKLLEIDQKQKKGDFAPQIMCDSEPDTEKPWASDCEHMTSIKPQKAMPGILGQGLVVCLSDPAPFQAGGYKGLTEKQRGDGTKDYWVHEIWKLRARGGVLDRILIDGSASQEWRHKAGAEEAIRLMKKYGARHWISENADEHWQYMLEAALPAGVSLVRGDKQGGPIKFKNYNQRDRKNVQFMALCESARLGEIWISVETCSQDFLYGDGEHTGFLTQCRKWRKIDEGKNSLRFDDHADCGSRVMDPKLLEFAPRPDVLAAQELFDDGYDDEDDYIRRSQHCGI